MLIHTNKYTIKLIKTETCIFTINNIYFTIATLFITWRKRMMYFMHLKPNSLSEHPIAWPYMHIQTRLAFVSSQVINFYNIRIYIKKNF